MLVKVLNARSKRSTIIVKCPKCGEVGILRAYRKNIFGKRSYKIIHDDKRSCKITILDENWEEINQIYVRIRL